MKTRYKIILVAVCAYFGVFFGPVITSNVYCDFVSQEMCTSRITGVVLPPLNLIMPSLPKDNCVVDNDGVMEPCYNDAGLLEWPFPPRMEVHTERECNKICADVEKLPPCTSDRTACFNQDAHLCDPSGWECGDNEGIFEEIIEYNSDATSYDLQMMFDEKESAVEYFVVNGNTDHVEIDIPTDLIDGVFMIHVNGENIDDKRVSIDGNKVIVNYGQNIESVKLFGSYDLGG
ncbi:hypothetical protein NZNM25_08380 [Nitrosopumilus zosterae]|uniref:Uncharacterized protein n=1 Tax=Nitrosopumilus zosterae TaxID=718286 RepID=A0A2S2KR55_9ARCH|nr:hypothetical protein [Nitrosopumilus zosterae]BDQ30518.1 hypothetical protein NZOSNM25_000622 [Nitrosopumilus zosterae]GBH34047.1 hypothetical protein NZNM25_08380 [Nitrosopumilus zosterae]